MAEYKDIELLKRQIADFKRAVKSENSDYLTGYVSALSAVEGMIAGQPAADVAPVKHGHWDDISEICSVCGKHWAEGMVMNADDYGYFDPMPAYCPYCGAKMDGERKEILCEE